MIKTSFISEWDESRSKACEEILNETVVCKKEDQCLKRE